MEKNRGYTMVEMIIVIAIIAILSGVAFVNIGIIKNAKCTAAATSLNNQITALYTQTMALSDLDNGVTNDKKLCMRIWNGQDNNGKTATKIEMGYIQSGAFVAKSGAEPVWISNVVNEIRYQPAAVDSSHALNSADSDVMIIMFSKSNGSVTYGAGDYSIIYNGQVMSTIHLDGVTGRHTIK